MAEDRIDDLDVESSDSFDQFVSSLQVDNRRLRIRREIENRQELKRLREEFGLDDFGWDDIP